MGKLDTVLAGRRGEKAAKRAVLFSLFAWFAASLVFDSIVLGAVLGLGLFPAVFAGLLYYPVLRKRNYGKRVEAGLPFVLLNIAIELNLGVDFGQCLRNAGRGRSEAAGEFRRAVHAVEKQGASVQEALLQMAERVQNRLVNRAVSQLVAVFEQGSRGQGGDGQGGKGQAGEAVKRIASEILTRQRIESRLFSGKLVVLSLLFIAISAIVPALFQSFVAAGSVVLQMRFTVPQVLLIITVLFPALDLGMLLYIRGKTPVFMRA